MNKSLKTIALFASAAALSFSSLSAQEATTKAVGFVSIEIAAGSVANPSWTFVSLPLQGPVSGESNSTGIVGAVGTNSFTSSAGGWSNDAFSATPHYVIVNSASTERGSVFRILSNTTTTLTVNNKGVDLATLSFAPGDTYEIVQGDTISSVFGSDVDGVVGGTSPNDPVDLLYVLSNGTWSTYYYNTSAGNWRKGNLPISQDNQPISPDDAVVYYRVGTEPLYYDLIGRVPDEGFSTTIPTSGFVALGTYFPVDQTLGELALQDLPWWRSQGVGGVTLNNADKVYVIENNVWVTYHYNGTSLRWQKGNLPIAQDSKLISAANGFLVGRSVGSASDEISLTLPYQSNN